MLRASTTYISIMAKETNFQMDSCSTSFDAKAEKRKGKEKNWTKVTSKHEIKVTLVSKESSCSIICKALLTARSQSTLLGMLWLLNINVGGACFGDLTMEEET